MLPFTEKQIDLVKNFAAQAVIAIENTRLLNELRELLQQQTATADVLKVISSSPSELEPVFKAMLESALRICEAEIGMLMLHHSGDGSFDTRVMVGAPPALVDALLHRSFAPPPGNPLDRMLRTKKTVHVVDAAAEKAKPLSAQLAGARSHISVPMVKQNEVVGAISIYRTEVKPFTDKQIELVSNFAAQAVIAIENARLLKELRRVCFEQQTATSEVLKVIATSAGGLEPVFATMLENAARICEAKFGAMLLSEGDKFRLAALYGAPPTFAEVRKPQSVFALGPSNNVSLAMHSKKAQHVADLRQHRSYIEREPGAVAIADLAGARTLVAVPMLKDNEPIGVILSIARKCVRSPTSRSSWCRTSPPKRSSPSRTRGCSASCVKSLSSRPQPPTCSR